MIFLDKTILQAILNSQNTQVKAVLATIIQTEGSTPRGLGTQMLVLETGQVIGTIGGGTAEKLISKRALGLVLSTADSEFKAEIHRLTINPETITDRLSVCGASIDVLLEPVQEKRFWKSAQDLQMNGKSVVMVTSLFSPYTKSILDSDGNVLLGLPQTGLMLSAKKLQEIHSYKQAQVIGLRKESSWLVEPVLETERLLILGAGHVAREVSFYAQSLDFQVTVIDDRATYALPEFFTGAYSVICSDFASGIQNYQPSTDTYVVIATWSHQTDAECLKDILNFTTKYVGMLGSTKKITSIVKYLQEKGYTSENLARLRAPIGLDINAQTPSEIAISILAEIISVKRSG